MPTLCQAGSHAAAGSATCSRCASGMFSSAAGAASCEACQAGSACAEGADGPMGCGPGTFSPAANQGSCGSCEAGSYQDGPGGTACKACELGAFCAKGASAALPCDGGSFANSTDLGAASECTACPPGGFCFAGATAATPCFPGTAAPAPSSILCSACAESKYQPHAGQTACQDCGAGFLCEEGSSVRLPASCNPGSYIDASVTFTSAADCWSCPPGVSCYGGSAQPKLCAPGTSAAGSGTVECASCSEGSFQNGVGATACIGCTPGYFCAEGATAPLPCPGGTHQNTTLAVMTSKEDCIICREGLYCPVGTSSPASCAPGTFNAQVSQATCGNCVSGTYQDEAGGTACAICRRGHFCGSGASTPIPCPSGVGTHAMAGCGMLAIRTREPLRPPVRHRYRRRSRGIFGRVTMLSRAAWLLGTHWQRCTRGMPDVGLLLPRGPPRHAVQRQ